MQTYTHTEWILFIFKKEGILSHTITQRSLEDILLNEINQKHTHKILHDSTDRSYLKQPNLQRHKVEWCLPGAGGGEKGVFSFSGCRVSVSGKTKKFWRRMVLMVAQRPEGAYCYQIIPSKMVKMVNFQSCYFNTGGESEQDSDAQVRSRGRRQEVGKRLPLMLMDNWPRPL